MQVACYAPGDTKAVYGNERLPGHSSFDPWAPDFAAFPQARGAKPHACVLKPGDVMLIPRGWWVATRQLTPGLALRHDWVSPGAHAARFQATLTSESNSAQTVLRAERVAGVDIEPPTPTNGIEGDPNDPTLDIFEVCVERQSECISCCFSYTACSHSVLPRTARGATPNSCVAACGRPQRRTVQPSTC